jgi:hypothetical protein
MTNEDRAEGRLEDRLRGTLAARDPGAPAPTGLRERVAAVPASASQTTPPFLGRSVHGAVVLVATAAAIVVGLVGVSALRVAAPSVGSPGGGPGPTPAAGVNLSSPGVPAPLTLDGGAVAAVLVSAVILAWFVVEALAAPFWAQRAVPAAAWRFSRGFGWLRLARPRRVVFAIALTAAVALPLAAGSATRLGEGSAGASSAVDLLGGRSGFVGQRPALFYAGTPGATISATLSVRNQGWVPLTVLGLDPAEVDLDTRYELRRFAVEDPNVLLSPDQATTVAFTPFELGPGEERDLVFVDHLGTCPILGGGTPSPGASASPSPAASLRPSASPDMENYGPPSGATESSIDSIPIRISTYGFGHTTWIPFAWSLIIVDPSPTCP